VRTDHHSLIWLKNFKEAEGMLARWLSVIFTYKFDIKHRPGVKHGNADALSRRPRRKCSHGGCVDCMKEIKDPEPVSIVVAESGGWFTGRDSADLARRQSQDPDLKPILEWKEQGTRPSKTTLIGLSWNTQRLLSQWESLVMSKGVLYRQLTLKKRKVTINQLVLPNSLRSEVFSLLHGNVVAGHNGWKKTYDLATQHYY
jgi:hypothetical protein